MIRIAYVDDNISESDDVIALLKRYIDSRCEEKDNCRVFLPTLWILYPIINFATI